MVRWSQGRDSPYLSCHLGGGREEADTNFCHCLCDVTWLDWSPQGGTFMGAAGHGGEQESKAPLGGAHFLVRGMLLPWVFILHFWIQSLLNHSSPSRENLLCFAPAGQTFLRISFWIISIYLAHFIYFSGTEYDTQLLAKPFWGIFFLTKC